MKHAIVTALILACQISLSLTQTVNKYLYNIIWAGKTIQNTNYCSTTPDYMTETKMDVESFVCEVYNTSPYQCRVLSGNPTKMSCVDQVNITLLASDKYALISSGPSRVFAKSGVCVPTGSTESTSNVFTCGSSQIDFKSCTDANCQTCNTTVLPFSQYYSCIEGSPSNSTTSTKSSQMRSASLPSWLQLLVCNIVLLLLVLV